MLGTEALSGMYCILHWLSCQTRVDAKCEAPEASRTASPEKLIRKSWLEAIGPRCDLK